MVWLTRLWVIKMISVQEVFFKYPALKEDTIQGISFDVKQGEIFGFLGPSGAGKSTMQKILTGVFRNYRGGVRIFGNEIKNRTSDYYEKIGVDFEFPNFYGKFTALENLKYFASLYSVNTTDPMLLLEKVGLRDDANKKVGNFSKGMKMRLGFVRCLMHNPQLLFPAPYAYFLAFLPSFWIGKLILGGAAALPFLLGLLLSLLWIIFFTRRFLTRIG